MKELQDRILKDGLVIGTDILKVNKFINHQVDPVLMADIGKEFATHFKDKAITKSCNDRKFRYCPGSNDCNRNGCTSCYIKKRPSKTLHNDLYQTEVTSYTTEKHYELCLSKDVISENDHVLLIDDFLCRRRSRNRFHPLTSNGTCNSCRYWNPH